MIYTVEARHLDSVRSKCAWVEVPCQAALNLELLDELISQNHVFESGIYTRCEHDPPEWWVGNCARSRAASYIWLAGIGVLHLGPKEWLHRAYAPALWSKMDEAELDEWVRRANRRKRAHGT